MTPLFLGTTFLLVCILSPHPVDGFLPKKMVNRLLLVSRGSVGDISSQPRLSLARNTPPPTSPSMDYSRMIKSVWSTLLTSVWLCSQTMGPLPVWAGDLPQTEAAVVASASTTITASDTSSSSTDASSNTIVDPQTVIIDAQRQVMDSSLQKDYVSGSQVAKAIVSLVSTKSPKGLEDGTLVDPSFDNPDAALICTAIGKHESPVAAKKFHLQGLHFPVFLELSVKDLMEPHTVESWLTSSLSQDNIAVTCIIDPDGKLATPEVSDRYGFGISDLNEPEEQEKKQEVEENEVAEVSTKTAVKQQQEKQNNREGAEAEEEIPLTREEVHINLNFRSDGRPYSETEMQLMEKIDTELERLGFSIQLGVSPIVKPPPAVVTAASSGAA